KPRAFPGGDFDAVITEVLGNADVYRDRDLFRRYALMHSVLDSTQGQAALLGGVYLLGWTESSQIPATLNSRQVETLDSTLVVVTLNPRVPEGAPGSALRLPPALFSWSLLGAEGTPATDLSPYGAYLYDGNYTLSFRLARPVTFRTVEALTLHLSSSGQTGPGGLSASLWAFDTGEWVSLGPLNWGDLAVGPAPGRYVSAAGEIRLRIERPGGTAPVSIERSDFTLVVSN
ncbi:MAG: hypothetical protein HY784_14650, partial [Chloroflexi bacterium]|nr:hypothetical protein [Chloroflexota bacterium]